MHQSATVSFNQSLVDVIRKKKNHLKVLLIGNNPIEMTNLYEKINGYKGKNYMADVCFDIKDSLKAIFRSKPDVIFLDDTITLFDNMKDFLSKVRDNSQIGRIPIVLMKSSNTSLSISNYVEDYLMKGSETAEILSNTIEKNVRLMKKIIRKKD